MSEELAIMEITPESLRPEILIPYIYGNKKQAWYWSDVWDSSFYVALARAGFISIATDLFDGRLLLIPQMHIDSAVLDWPDRHISKNLSAFIRSGKTTELGLSLRITRNLERVMDCLGNCWAGDSWLHTPYRNIMNELAQKSREESQDFVPVGIELWAKDCDRPVAGELGYVIGSIYTSLSGFMHPDRSAWNNVGKLQLQALGVFLEQSGFSFWNLGQPQMQYKIDLGARVTPRPEFLRRWIPAVHEPIPPAFFEYLEVPIPVDPLLQIAISSV